MAVSSQKTWASFPIWTRLSIHHSQKYTNQSSRFYLIRLISLVQVLFLVLRNLEFNTTSSKFLLQPVVKYLNSVIEFQKIADLLKASSSVWMLFVVLIAYFLFIVILILFRFPYREPDASGSIHLVSNMTTFHTEILFYPVSFALFKIIEISLNDELNLVIPSGVCLSIAGILCFVNIIITFLKIGFCYSITNSKLFISRKGSLHLLGIAVLKLILPILHILQVNNVSENQALHKMTSVVISLAISFVTIVYFKLVFPEYDINLMRLHIIFNSTIVGVTISQLITLIADDEGSFLNFVFLAFPFWIKFNLNLFNYMIKGLAYYLNNVGNINYLVHLETVYLDLEQKVKLNVINASYPEERLSAYWLSHKSFKGSSSKMVALFRKHYEKFQTKKLSSSLSSLAYANLLLKYFNMVPKAYSLCLPVLNRKFNIPGKIAAYEILCKIEKSLQKAVVKQSEGNQAFQVAWDSFLAESAFDGLHSALSKYTQDALSFWRLLKTDNPNILTLIAKARSLNSQRILMQSHWRKHESKFSANFPLAYLIYGTFQAQFLGRPWEGTEKTNKYEKITVAANRNMMREMYNINSNEFIVITVSTEKKEMGKVLNVSENFSKAFGIDKKAFIGNNVNQIMPKFFAEKHPQFLLNYYETGETRMIGRESRHYAKDRNNYIFPISMSLLLQHNEDHGIVYSALVKKLREPYEYILVGDDGFIEEVSEKIQILLDLDPEKPTHIQGIFPGYQQGSELVSTFMISLNPKRPPIKCKIKTDCLTYGTSIYAISVCFEETSTGNKQDDVDEQKKGPEEFEEIDEIPRIEAKFTPARNILPDSSISRASTGIKKGEVLIHAKPHAKEESLVQKSTDALTNSKKISNSTNALSPQSRIISEKTKSYKELAQTKIADHLQNMFEKSYSSKARSLITCAFISLIFINITILCVQYITFKESINDIKFTVEVVDASYERLNALSWIFRYAVRYQAVVTGIATVTFEELDRYKSIISTNRDYIKEANDGLLSSVLNGLEEEQKKFFEESIVLTYSSEDGHLQQRITNGFDSINIFIEKLMKFDITPHSVLIESGNPDLEFVRKNSADSLLIASEDLIDVTKRSLASKSSTKQTLLSVVFSLSVPVAIICSLIIVVVSYSDLKNTKIVVKRVLSIHHQDIDVIIWKYESFNKMLSSKEKLESKRVYATNSKKDNMNAKHGAYSLAAIKFNVKGLFSIKVKQSLFIIFLVCCFLVTNFLEYYLASVQFQDLLEMNNRLFVGSRARFLINMASATVFDLIVFRNTTTIRNEPLGKQFNQNLDDIVSNDMLFKAFTDEKGQFIDPSLERLFKEKPCSLVVNYPGSNNPTNCPKATDYDTIGIFAVNARYPQELYTLGRQMLNNLTVENSKVMFPLMVSSLGHKTSTLVGAFLFVIELMQQMFYQKIDTIFTESPRRLALEISLMGILGLITIWFLYKKVLDDSTVRVVLKLIPYNEVAKNKLLQNIIKNLYKGNKDLKNINNRIGA